MAARQRRRSSGFSRRFGIPGVISTLALIFAMTGGAVAAKYLITSTKQISPSVLKKLKGAKGATGPAGPAGPAGAQGSAGAAGAKGATGATGTQGEKGEKGTNGTNGTSVANTVEPKGANCAEGGSKFVGTSTTFACNGTSVTNTVEPKGANCAEGGSKFVGTSTTFACNGKDATFDGSALKAGVTMTGGWSVSGSAGEKVVEAISFPIKLATAIGAANVHYSEEAGFETNCPPPGTGVNPVANSGHLCVYKIISEGSVEEPGEGIIWDLSFGAKGASKQGALLWFNMGAGGGNVSGSWAVTG